jgi:hypothetical protein
MAFQTKGIMHICIHSNMYSYIIGSSDDKLVQGKKKAADAIKEPKTYEEAAEMLEDEAEEVEDELRPAQLQICLSITNTGDTEFQFQAASLADFAVKDMNIHYDSVRLVGLGYRHAIDLKDSRKAEIIFNDLPFTHPIPRPGAACLPVIICASPQHVVIAHRFPDQPS